MELYILRHAIAVERGTPGYDRDFDRVLTPKGAKKMRRVAQGMKSMDLSFDVILSSPLLRAKETADIVAEVFKLRKKLKFTDTLATGGSAKALIDEINGTYAACERVLLVGHEPYLSSLISFLLAGDEGLSITLKKGGLCKLLIGRLGYTRCATLEWLLTPSALASIS